MDPHRFEHEDDSYEVHFERKPEGWIARIRREGDGTVHTFAFPEGPGYDPNDVRGSLIAGCEAVAGRLPRTLPTLH